MSNIPPSMPVTVLPAVRPLAPIDRAVLEAAVGRLMGSRGVVVRVADLLGGLFGTAAAAGWRGLKIPDGVTRQLRGIAETAMRRAFDIAILGRQQTAWAANPSQARLVAIITGAVSGFMGLAGFLPDATATTLLIMRNIAAIAAEEGEDLDDAASRQACIEVFALGSPGYGDIAEEGETGYWSARLVMHGRPMSLLLSEAAATYGLRLSSRFTSAIVPMVGAASGALVNSTFLDHYRNVARVHFTIRRLERSYGQPEVRREAEQIAATLRAARRPSAFERAATAMA